MSIYYLLFLIQLLSITNSLLFTKQLKCIQNHQILDVTSSRRLFLRLSSSLSDTDSLSWITSMNGIKLNNIVIEKFNQDKIRGMKSINGITDNSIPLVSVPSEFVLEVTNNRPPTPFPSFVTQELWEKSLWYHRLAFKLLYEYKVLKSSSSKLSWFNELPKSFTTPIHWKENEVNELQYTSIKKKIKNQSKDWLQFYNEWLATNKEAQLITYKDFEWALECINSRAFSGVYEGSSAQERSSLLIFTGILTLAWPLLNLGTYEQSISAALIVGLSILARDVIFSKSGSLKRYVMCPVIDMFNHKSTCTSDVSYNYFSNQFELRTGNYKANEQVFISYGKQSNDRLLQYYGFVEEYNPYDSYDFGINILELILKYADVMSEDNLIPNISSVTPQERLKIIAMALKNTQVDESTYTGVKSRTSIQSGDEIHSRYFRSSLNNLRPTLTTTTSTSVVNENNQDSSTTTTITNNNAIIQKFDDITIRVLRALYSSLEEWKQIFSDSHAGNAGNNVSLEKLGAPLSTSTELAIAKALKAIVYTELQSKPTTLEEDVLLLNNKKQSNNNSSNNSNTNSKGFTDKKPMKAMSNTNKANMKVEIDPSGVYSDTELAILTFRIEKKLLLLEAINL